MTNNFTPKTLTTWGGLQQDLSNCPLNLFKLDIATINERNCLKESAQAFVNMLDVISAPDDKRDLIPKSIARLKAEYAGKNQTVTSVTELKNSFVFIINGDSANPRVFQHHTQIGIQKSIDERQANAEKAEAERLARAKQFQNDLSLVCITLAYKAHQETTKQRYPVRFDLPTKFCPVGKLVDEASGKTIAEFTVRELAHEAGHITHVLESTYVRLQNNAKKAQQNCEKNNGGSQFQRGGLEAAQRELRLHETLMKKAGVELPGASHLAGILMDHLLYPKFTNQATQ